MTKKRIDLDSLVSEDGGEVVLGGTTHRVFPISGAGIDRLTNAEPAERIRALYDVAAMCVPSLTREAVNALAPKQAEAIVDMATSAASAVEQQEASDPNGARPESVTASPA